MPIQLTCPTCSTQLSVKDENAGRAVKCPKCAAIIQPPAPAEPPIVEALPIEPSGSEPKITGRPIARAASARSEDASKSSRDRAEESSDRERTRRRERNDGDNRPPKASGGTNVLLILGIVGFLMLSCCGAVGFGVYWAFNKAKEAAQQIKDDLEKWNTRISLANYDRMKIGSTTRAQAEGMLGASRPLTDVDLHTLFPDDQDKFNDWGHMITGNRAVIWRNGDDYLLAAFHPNGNVDSRLQMKEFRPKNGANAYNGEPIDAKFLANFPPPPPTEIIKPRDKIDPKGTDEEPSGTILTVSAKALTQEFKDDEAAANAKYKDKWLLVEGSVAPQFGYGFTPETGIVTVELQGVRHPGDRIDFNLKCSSRTDSAAAMLNTARGQSLTIKGKCTGGGTQLTFVKLEHCRIDKAGPDTVLTARAGNLILEFTKDGKGSNEKYGDKEVLITDAVFVRVGDSLAMFNGSPKGLPIAIQANFTHNFNPRLAELKPGDRVKFRARAGGLFPHKDMSPDKKGPTQVISMYYAYIVP